MLKKWYPPVTTSFQSVEDMEVDEEEFDQRVSNEQ